MLVGSQQLACTSSTENHCRHRHDDWLHLYLDSQGRSVCGKMLICRCHCMISLDISRFSAVFSSAFMLAPPALPLSLSSQLFSAWHSIQRFRKILGCHQQYLRPHSHLSIRQRLQRPPKDHSHVSSCLMALPRIVHCSSGWQANHTSH